MVIGFEVTIPSFGLSETPRDTWTEYTPGWPTSNSRLISAHQFQ